MQDMYEVADRVLVIILMAGLPLLAVVLVSGVISLVLQTVTMVRDDSIVVSIRLIVLLIVGYAVFPGFVEQLHELFQLCFRLRGFA